jgi:hypothetical protein
MKTLLMLLLLLIICINASATEPNYANVRSFITSVTPTSSNSPASERSPNAVDGNVGSKYLNFDKFNAGFTVQLSQAEVVQGMQFTTANDSPGRDPTSFTLYGSNDGSTWTTLTANQSISLSNSRYAESSVYTLTNSTSFLYYRIIFPTIKDNASNSMQIAEVAFLYDTNYNAVPALCCGGSASIFSASSQNVNKVMSFVGRTTQDSQVYVEQVGNQNIVTVEQTGTKNNYAKYSGNGSNDIVSITQSGNNSTQVNYADLTITGDTNTATLLQQSTGGAKGVFATVIDDNNSLIVTQKDSGSHYAEINLSGGNKNVDITQQGSASHMASISLSGLPVDLSLSQSGSTQQFYSIQFNCATTGGCPKITVTQGN